MMTALRLSGCQASGATQLVSNAHDAMADVYATIAMAKLVKTAQPRLFEYLLSHRSKQKLMTLIDQSASSVSAYCDDSTDTQTGVVVRF